MSSKRDREKRREERLAEQNEADAADRRTKLLQLSAGAAFLVLAVVVVLIVISSSGSDGGDAENLEGAADVERMLAGIPQNGMVLGDPAAAVELVEFGDLQCPGCKAYAEEVLPPVIESQIKQGQAKIDFRNFTIIGPESETAGAAAIAAGEQGRGWNFVELFYKNQGRENGGYVTDEFLTAVAEAAGVKDIARWDRERKSEQILAKVKATSREAQELGLPGTPSFAVKGPGTNGLEPFEAGGSSGTIEAAVDSASLG